MFVVSVSGCISSYFFILQPIELVKLESFGRFLDGSSSRGYGVAATAFPRGEILRSKSMQLDVRNFYDGMSFCCLIFFCCSCNFSSCSSNSFWFSPTCVFCSWQLPWWTILHVPLCWRHSMNYSDVRRSVNPWRLASPTMFALVTCLLNVLVRPIWFCSLLLKSINLSALIAVLLIAAVIGSAGLLIAAFIESMLTRSNMPKILYFPRLQYVRFLLFKVSCLCFLPNLKVKINGYAIFGGQFSMSSESQLTIVWMGDGRKVLRSLIGFHCLMIDSSFPLRFSSQFVYGVILTRS